ncbi:MAG TPA: hypothetical protein ENK38_05540, partial [Gammaproteobacteria bacterium]|nr:hypothetical protein [Gammaproteobacteria bacterium]
MNYEQRFTWQHVYDGRVLIHSDGACSLMIGWDGVDPELIDADELQGRFLLLRQLLERLPEQVTLEFHLWRELDPSLAKSYFERHKQFVRAREIGTALRHSMSTHLAQYGLSNTIGLVLTWHKGTGLLDRLLPKRGLVNQGHNAEALLQLAAEMGETLPGATVLEADRYLERIGQSCDRDGWSAGRRLYCRPEFFINEQAITGKPVLEKGLLRLGDSYTKVMLLYLYPDAWPGMSAELSAFPGQLHISHILRRTNTRAAMQASEKAENFTKGTTTHTGTEQKDQKVDAEGGFRHTVIANNYQVFANTYIIHLHHDDPAQLRRDANRLAGQIDRLGGQLRMSDDVQLLFWRFAQPGQGYRASWSRPDHSRQVADMLPVQMYNAGDRDPMMLRLSHTGQLVGMSYHPDRVNHSITAAMTGGGKGVNKVAQILETYPLGIDWYIMEVGTSYQWTVEALGGTYSRIDPGETVVNPLPLYSAAIPDGEGIPRLPIEMITGTAESLAFILTDSLQLTTAQEAVAQSAFSIMYGVEETSHNQPTFETLLDYLQLADNYANNETELTEARAMANRLESFLSTAEGRVFARPNNFHLSEGITGVDLLLVRNKAKRLLKFYLVFLSLAFAQKAFSSPHRS